jgi:hypothetical protein
MNARTQKPIPVGKLTEKLFREYPVWEFTNDDEPDEAFVRPVKNFPVSSGDSRLFGCIVLLADGSAAFGLLGNISLSSSQQNAHFRTLSLFVRGQEHYLSRYHDFDFEKHGSTALAKALGKKVEQVFPIAYDLSPFAIGAPDYIRASIPAKPEKKLSRSEIIRLALE